MRKIKFRAWLKLENKLIDIKQLNFDVQTITHEYIRKKQENPFCKGYPNTNFSDLILMQYTELKDNNGKDIYEGDILNYKSFTFPEHKGVWVVKWNAYFWDVIRQFKEMYHGDKGIGCFEGQDFLWKKHDKMEVIGNIYENPESLRGRDTV